MKKYIHYGHSKYNDNLFESVTNFHIKPLGGLWASPADSEYGFKEWVRDNDYEIDLRLYFSFELTENAKVKTIRKISDIRDLPQIKGVLPSIVPWITLDFEKISKEYDALEIYISADDEIEERFPSWDCDSIIVFNKNSIRLLK